MPYQRHKTGNNLACRLTGRSGCAARVLSASIALVLSFLSATSVLADTPLECCATIDDRIAQLERELARTHQRNLAVSISGAVNRALLIWDDGKSDDAFVVTNDSDGTNLAIEAERELNSPGLSVGFVLEFDLLNAGSGDVSQNDPRAETQIEVSETSVWFEDDLLGRLAYGLTSSKGASDGANEADLSRTEVAASVNVADTSGGYFLRKADANGGINEQGATWGDLFDSLDQPDGNVITYNTPDYNGYSLSALWGTGNIWSLALGVDKKLGSDVHIKAGTAVSRDQQDDEDQVSDGHTVSGSIAALHYPSGLNAAISVGLRKNATAVRLNDGSFGNAQDEQFLYGKAGFLTQFMPQTATGFYAEYGTFRNMAGRDSNAQVIASLSGVSQQNVCGGIGLACLISNSEANVWGFGIVHHIGSEPLPDSESAIQLYVGYRNYEARTKLVDVDLDRVSSPTTENFQTILMGAIVEF